MQKTLVFRYQKLPPPLLHALQYPVCFNPRARIRRDDDLVQAFGGFKVSIHAPV